MGIGHVIGKERWAALGDSGHERIGSEAESNVFSLGLYVRITVAAHMMMRGRTCSQIWKIKFENV